VDLDLFRNLVTEAFQALPGSFRKKIENLAIEVEEAALMDGDRVILGQYQGVPLTDRTSYYGNVLPDRIVIFKGSIEQVTEDPDRIKRLVQEVIRHEVGHYFGLDEDDMKQ
jgi:predicted Zn-dependent protease with MMP-like domain